MRIESGDYLPRADVLSTWQRRFSILRSRLLGIPSRVAARTSGKTTRDEVLLAVEQELYQGLLECSGTTSGETDA